MRILRTEKNVPGMSKEEIDQYLGGKLILRLGTIDVGGGPAIHPVWFYHANDRLYVWSGKNARKIRNIRKNVRVYFTVDTDATPNRGVRGKGTARLIPELSERRKWAELIVGKYLEESSPMYKGMMSYAKSDETSIAEITPDYYAVWDYSKLK